MKRKVLSVLRRFAVAAVYLAAIATGACDTVWSKTTLYGTAVGHSKAAIPTKATIIINPTEIRLQTDSAGTFSVDLEAGAYKLYAFAPGFEPTSRLLNITGDSVVHVVIALKSGRAIQTEEVMVYGDTYPIPAGSDHLAGQTIEDILGDAQGVCMIRRADFGGEATIRGYSKGQIGVLIDGMRIVGACVDHMDPITSYVEPENLEKLEISKGGFDLGHQTTLGGTINLVTQTARYDQPLYAALRSEYGSAATTRSVSGEINGVLGPFALRAAYAERRADNFRAGDATDVAGSGFAKNNYKIDLALRISDAHMAQASFIGDRAADVGYPALLMDARRAQARIGHIRHEWKNPGASLYSIRSMAYFSHIDHWMDDYDRSEAELRSRAVMANMNMPMFGQTRTLGIVEKVAIAGTGFTLDITGEYNSLTAFADMDMISLDQGIADMYLVNLADVREDNIGLTADLSVSITEELLAEFVVRSDISTRKLHNEEGKNALEASAGASANGGTDIVSGISSSLRWAFAERQNATLSAARTQRLPTHLEQYGFFLYNVGDGYFYFGNPGLEPETAYQIEASYAYTGKRYGFTATAFVHRLENAIIGEEIDNDFRTYTNRGAALKTGFESTGFIRAASNLTLSAAATFTFAEHLELRDPLPFTPQPELTMALRYTPQPLSLELSMRALGSQRRVSRIILAEDAIPGSITFHIRGSAAIAPFLDIAAGIENIFDAFYRERFNIGGLPNPGRNAYIRATLHTFNNP